MITNVAGLNPMSSPDPFAGFAVEFEGALRAPTIDQADGVPEMSFAQTLQNALGEVNETKVAAERVTLDFAAGKPVDVHEMMITVAKADVLMQVTSTVVSKAATSVNQLLQTQI